MVSLPRCLTLAAAFAAAAGLAGCNSVPQIMPKPSAAATQAKVSPSAARALAQQQQKASQQASLFDWADPFADEPVALATPVTPSPVATPVTPEIKEPTQLASISSKGDESFSGVYGEVKDGAFTVPAVKPAHLNPAFMRKKVAYSTSEPAGSIVIDPAAHYLYYVEGGGQATRYGVGVGREGFIWAGDAKIKNKQEWPDWYPPKEMVARRPDLQGKMAKLQSGEGMHGGPSNPLGARAMYLWQGDKDTLFRIHGTNEPWSIGHSESSGCIRMINQDAIDLYSKVQPGAKVVVLGSRGAMPIETAAQRPDEKPAKKKVSMR